LLTPQIAVLTMSRGEDQQWEFALVGAIAE
jgi:hypothetical protein